MDPVEPGIACGSDTAHLSILGYPPDREYRGRGAFESMGAGLEMREGDIAFKSVFATLAPGPRATGTELAAATTVQGAGSAGEDLAAPIVALRKCDKDFESWGVPLCEALSGVRLRSFPEVEVSVLFSTEHRCGVRLRAPGGLSDLVTDTDPLQDGRPLLRAQPLPAVPASAGACAAAGAPEAAVRADAARMAAARTAAIVNELSDACRETLAAHPITRQRRAAGLPVADVLLFRCVPRPPLSHSNRC